jgi:hypothetical protein
VETIAVLSATTAIFYGTAATVLPLFVITLAFQVRVVRVFVGQARPF